MLPFEAANNCISCPDFVAGWVGGVAVGCQPRHVQGVCGKESLGVCACLAAG